MVKPEWGTKRACPKCGTRFYDLGKDDPVTCIACGATWEPEPILKSKQPLPFEAAPKSDEKKDTKTNGEGGDDHDVDLDLAEDEGEASPDDEVDLGGDDDLGVNTADDEEES